MADTATRPRFAILFGVAVAFVFFLAADSFLSPPDTAFYWYWGESLFSDLDFDFLDEFVAGQVPAHYTYITETGRLANDWPPGTGFAIGPLALLPPVFAHAWMTVLVFASLAFWAARAEIAKAARLPAIVAVVAGTPLLFYALFGPFFSHVPAFAVTTVFLTLWARRGAKDRSGGEWLVLGLLIGAAALIRPQNVLLGLVLLADVRSVTRRPPVELPRKLLLFALGGLLAFAPQMIVWSRLYGSLLALPKVEEMHWLSPAIGKVLFSDFHGMLPWTPVYVPAIAGLCLMFRRNARIAAGLAIVFVTQLYLNSANAVWWSGGSFGNRRMLDSAIVAGWGIAALVGWSDRRNWRIATSGLVLACCAWSVWLLLAERAGSLPLSRYVPFLDAHFPEILLSVAIDPARLVEGLVRWEDHSAGAIAIRAVAALLAGGGVAAAAMAANRWPFLPERTAPVAFSAAAAAFLPLVVVAALRTPRQEDPVVIETAGTQAAVLWDNYIELTYYRMLHDDFAGAEESARQAVELRPDAMSGWFELGRALSFQGRYVSAVEAYDRALELNPDHELSKAFRASAIAQIRSSRKPP